MIAPNISVLQYDISSEAIVLILLSCGAAIAVNLSSMALIGKTSAVTFQVVGHGKTILILGFGSVFSPSTASGEDLLKHAAGIAIALLGVFAYSYFKVSQK